jgi:hypothetical protein
MPLVKLRGNSYDITDDQLFHEISIVIDNVLGEDSSKLIFKTLELVYKTNYETSLSSRLDAFEKSLKMVLGKRTSGLVFESAVSNLQKYRVSSGDEDSQ